MYGILSTQLVITAIICSVPYFNLQARLFFLTHYWLALCCTIAAILLVCLLVCVKGLARDVPVNYFLLFVFTLLEAYAVAFCCAVYDGLIVLAAASMTAAVVVSLTLYAVYTSTDFTVCGGTLSVIGSALFVFGIISF